MFWKQFRKVSHVVRGFGLGVVVSAVYVVARKGKEVDLSRERPCVFEWTTVTVPPVSASNTGCSSR